MAGKEVATKGDTSPYAIANLGTGESNTTLAEIMRENVGAGGITPFDLDRVKVPSGAGTAWELPTLTGETDVAKAFTGIIVAWREPRSYWVKGLDEGGGNQPPDCASDDGATGVGTPGGECAVCPLAQFGSGKEQRGQACKQMRLLFIVRENALLPIALFAPPTSIANIRKYFLRLASEGKHYSSVVTNFTLSKATSGGGIDYSKIDVNVDRLLTDAESKAVLEYSRGISGALAGVKLTQEDVH